VLTVRRLREALARKGLALLADALRYARALYPEARVRAEGRANDEPGLDVRAAWPCGPSPREKSKIAN